MKQWKIEFLSIIIGFLSAFVIGFIFLAIQGYDSWQGFSTLISNTFSSDISLDIWMYRSTVLILTGTAASIFFISGTVNLGQQGTVLIGIISVLTFSRYFNFSPIIQIPLILLYAVISSCLWNGILLFFRFAYNMNEMISSLMFNFIARFLLSYLAVNVFLRKGATSVQSDLIPSSSNINNLGAFILVIVFTVCIYLFVKFHYIGYEMDLKGRNPFFTRLSGCSNKKIMLFSTIIASLCSGIAGAFLLMGGSQHAYVSGLEGNFGWDGVMIAMMASNNILLIPLYAMFFSILQTGAVGMEVLTGVPSEFTVIFQGITVFCIVAIRDLSIKYFQKQKARIQFKKSKEQKI